MPTNKEIMQAIYASFAKGDVPTVLAAMDPKIEWTEAEGWPLYSGTLVGPQAVVDGVFMRLGEIGDNFSVNVDSVGRRGRHRGGPRHLHLEPHGLRRARRSEDCPRVDPRRMGRSRGSNNMSTPPRSAISSPETSVGNRLVVAGTFRPAFAAAPRAMQAECRDLEQGGASRGVGTMPTPREYTGGMPGDIPGHLGASRSHRRSACRDAPRCESCLSMVFTAMRRWGWRGCAGSDR